MAACFQENVRRCQVTLPTRLFGCLAFAAAEGTRCDSDHKVHCGTVIPRLFAGLGVSPGPLYAASLSLP
jgi:hypothetical protein